MPVLTIHVSFGGSCEPTPPQVRGLHCNLSLSCSVIDHYLTLTMGLAAPAKVYVQPFGALPTQINEQDKQRGWLWNIDWFIYWGRQGAKGLHTRTVVKHGITW